jgi:hypothetical protein
MVWVVILRSLEGGHSFEGTGCIHLYINTKAGSSKFFLKCWYAPIRLHGVKMKMTIIRKSDADKQGWISVTGTYWLPNSDATNRNPVFITHMADATGTVSKYFSFISVTMSSSVSKVILKISPCSVCARKKNIDLVLCVAEHTKIIPLSGSSRSFCNK